MPNTNLKSALDGAKAVKVFDGGVGRTVMVWHGGTTINVYNVFDGEWHETTMFSLSDEKGRPEDRETVIEHMKSVWAEQVEE